MGAWYRIPPVEFLHTPEWFIDILEERLDDKLKSIEKGKILHFEELWTARGISLALSPR